MTQMIEPPNSVALLVGREHFTPPATFDGQTCAATNDCVAIGVVNVQDAPTMVTLSASPRISDLLKLGEFAIESEGLLSVRDVHNREYQSVGVPSGVTLVTVWGNDGTEPCEVVLQVNTEPSTRTIVLPR